jgi:RNA recognition motif-containing protein
MPKRIYVGNLPEGTTARELRTLLSSYGTVESVQIDERKRVASVEVAKVGRSLPRRLTLRGATLNVNEA